MPMKKLFTFILIGVLTFSLWAQAPQKMSYQFVVRNSGGELITNHGIGVRLTILQGSPSGTVVYEEIFNPNPVSNANGLVTVEIGTGLVISGNFSTINWAAGPYYLKSEVDPTGATDYTVTGTNQLISVPYSFYSNTTGTIPDNVVTSAKITDGSVATADLANGSVTSVKIADAAVSTVDIATNAVIADKINAGAVTGDKIAQAGATNGQVLKWNTTTWAPANDAIGVPGGTTGNVQFNNAGALGGDANLSWDNTGKKLGIGISNPSYTLHVTGSLMRSIHSETTYEGGAAIFGLGNNVSGQNVGVRGISNSTNGTGIMGDATAETGVTYAVKGKVTSASGFSGHFTGGKFYVAGNVGIGNDSPDAKLDVDGTINIGGTNASELNRAQTSDANLVPIAYGQVNGNGTFGAAASTKNFTVTKTGTGVYEITITGELFYYSKYTVSAAFIGSEPGFITANSVNNILLIHTYDKAGVPMDQFFYFVVYKP